MLCLVIEVRAGEVVPALTLFSTIFPCCAITHQASAKAGFSISVIAGLSKIEIKVYPASRRRCCCLP